MENQQENRICQNCKTEFIIEPEDFDFYKKIDVPAPTWCPECRNLRRMMWREERTLYKNVCGLCGKQIITIHAPGTSFTVYCRECWFSDKWDPMDYGREYDFSQPFFVQYRKLLEAVPRPAFTGTNLIESEYSHAGQSLKNCYYVFWSYFSENSQFDYGLLFSKDTYDSYVVDNSDHVYFSLHSNRLYRTQFGYFSDECLDSLFLFDCVGCSDCFGCVNLRKQKYCIFNEKFSKEEYFSKLKYWDLGSYKKLQEAKTKFRAFYLSLPRRYAHVLNSQNVTGDIIRDTKNCKTCFSALDNVENCKYIYFGGLGLKDSYDVGGGGINSQLLYEIYAMTRNVERCFFSAGGNNSIDTMYCDWARNSSHSIGCVSIQNKKYCILNRQYTKEEYETLSKVIRVHMDDMPYIDKKGRIYKFGEFFPPEFSAYAYNESAAFPWYPRTKEEILEEGWQWRDEAERNYKISLKYGDIPDHINDVPDSILDEIIECEHSTNVWQTEHNACLDGCTKAFRITKEELAFHREMNIALPRLCPSCRTAEILSWRNGFHLYRRRCQCNQPKIKDQKLLPYTNTTEHFHGDKSCPNEFETTFSPEQEEIIYCHDCYKSEFL
ncbi:MAG: hypothetical protein AB1333_01650 [Patescibacteria group bacterium]